MSKKKANLTIVFADVAGSTKLYETLGDVKARETVSLALDAIIDQVNRYGGVVIKTIGDEVMCTFPDAETGVNACRAMQESIEDENQNMPEVNLAIRVGLHHGPVIMEDNDIFGDAVNVSARMAALAKATQIITTKDTIEMLSPALRADTRFTDRAPVKGKKETIDIFEILWQEDQEDVTRMATDVIKTTLPPVKMMLRTEGIEMELDEDHQQCVMGRGNTCDMVINDSMSSRQHVRVEYRRGKFFIVDQSTNGTYVRIDNVEDAFLRREEMQLKGTGTISLGRDFDEAPQTNVTFTCTG